jgi:hypothetical protein
MSLHSALETAFENNQPFHWALLDDPHVIGSISSPIFQVFVNICDEWGVPVQQRLKLLGGIIGEATYHNWKSGKSMKLNLALIERISLVLGIYKGLNLIFLNENKSQEWLKSLNDEPLFAAMSPVQFMLQGPVENLYRVRKYLDAWRGIK